MPYSNIMTRSKLNPPEQVPDDVSALTREETSTKATTKHAGARRPSGKATSRHR